MFARSSSAAAKTTAAVTIASIAFISLPAFAQPIPAATVPSSSECILSGRQDCTVEKFVPLFGQAIVAKFNKIGKSGTFYDNRTIQTSSFDFQSYMHDTCFSPTVNDLPTCRKEFGPYAILQETMLNGTLMNILYANRQYIGQAYGLVPMIVESINADNANVSDGSGKYSYTDDLSAQRVRGAIVWNACVSRYPADRNYAVRCYLFNQRLTKLSIPVLQNMNYNSWMN